MVGMAALETVTLTILVFPSSICETAIVLAVSEGYYCDIWVSRVAGQIEGNGGRSRQLKRDVEGIDPVGLFQQPQYSVRYSKKLNYGLCVK